MEPSTEIRIADQAGNESEAAFSRAFERHSAVLSSGISASRRLTGDAGKPLPTIR